MQQELTADDTARAAIRTLGATWWQHWMITIFGKRVQHGGHTWAYWRGQLWFVREAVLSEEFSSTDDKRTANNAVRHQYRKLSADEKVVIERMKDLGAEFIELCASAGDSRELSIAKTKIEEAVMWAVKHVTS